MKGLLGGLLIAAGAVVLAVGALTVAEHLLRGSSRRRPARGMTDEAPTPAAAVPVAEPKPVVETLVPKKDAQRNFSIKRTKSEVGYVYWILEGYGKYKCFILCDSWDEAVEQAKVRLAEIDGVSEPASETVTVNS